MTIKKQFNFFLAAIVILPFFTILFVMTFSRMTSAEKIFLRGYKRLQKLEILPLTDTDWNMISTAVKDFPRENQACLIAHNKVIISNFPELKEDSVISENQLWDFIKLTSNEYYYQLETPPLGTQEHRVFLISRMNKNQHSREKKFLTIFISLLLAFTIFCAVIIFMISQSITSSITILEEQTKKIADGDLDVKIDINQKKKNEITNMSISLEQMRASLKEAQDRRSRFVMGISHDLRTPIAIIKGYAEALADGMIENEEERNSSLDIILKKSNQLESMVDTLISYEKLSTDEWKAKMEDISLYDFLNTFTKTGSTIANVFKRKIHYSITIPKDIKVPMDLMLAQRAFENIFSNALRYTKENDLISIKGEIKDDTAVISISDTGCGIGDNDIKNIFELFYRGTTSRREEGMGIGLSVVKNIIDIHNWKIEVKSKVSEGTTFFIYIPLKKANLFRG